MSDLVRAALDTIVNGGTLTLDEAHAAMGAVMDGEATPAQLAALLMGLRMRGETADELAGLRDRDARARRSRRGARGRDRRRRHGRRQLRDVQHLDHLGARRGRRRRARRQARESGDDLALGVGGRARRARHPDRPRRGLGRRRAARPRFRLPVRCELPPGDALRRPDPARDRRPDRVQPAGAADQPGRHAPPAAGCG